MSSSRSRSDWTVVRVRAKFARGSFTHSQEHPMPDLSTWRKALAGAQQLWTWCCRNPAPYETYVAVAERGEPWPDEVPAGPGHNSQAVDPAGAMLEEIQTLQHTAAEWLAVASPLSQPVEADRAANFAERFAQLERQAEEA